MCIYSLKKAPIINLQQYHHFPLLISASSISSPISDHVKIAGRYYASCLECYGALNDQNPNLIGRSKCQVKHTPSFVVRQSIYDATAEDILIRGN